MTFKDQIFLRAATLPWWQRYSITILLLIILVGLWWKFNYQKLYAQLRARSVQTAVSQQSNLATNNIKQVLQQKSDAFFTCTSPHQVIHTLIETAHNNKLIVEACSAQESTTNTFTHESIPNKPWYTKRKITCSVSGSFFDLVTFFEHVQKSCSNLLWQRCEIITNSPEQTVTCHCSFVLYSKL